MPMNFLETENVVKQYASHLALNKVSIQVPEGKVFGLLGPNGAGKTTLIRIINRITAPDSGLVRFNGREFQPEDIYHIGYLPEERGLYKKMKVGEQAIYLAQLKGLSYQEARTRLIRWFEKFDIMPWWNKKLEELSKGMQQKIQFIITIIHEPKLLIFDEPFSGFDPINGALLQQLIRRLHDRGTTIMLSSHNMPAIEEICSDIALINHGKLLLNGHIADIKEAHQTHNLLLTTRKELSLQLLLDSGLIAEATPTETRNWRKGCAYRLRKRENAKNADILDAVAIQGEILHFEEELPTLNDIFISYASPKAEA